MKNPELSDLTIIVPTYHRPKWVKIFILTLLELKYTGKILICDGSQQEISQEVQFICNSFNNDKIAYINVPKVQGESTGSNINRGLIEAHNNIDTSFFMITCDDDIPLPSNLIKCLVFLKNNRSFAGATGEYPWVDISVLHKAHQNIFSIYNPLFLSGRRRGLNSSFSILSESPVERIFEFQGSKLFNTMFCVMRSKFLPIIYNEYHKHIETPHLNGEYSWFYGAVISGKIFKFNSPHVIRVFHGDNLSIQNGNHPYPLFTESLFSKSWPNDAYYFMKSISAKLQRFSSIPRENSKAIAQELLLRIICSRITFTYEKNKQRLSFLSKKIIPLTLSLLITIKYTILIFKHSRVYVTASRALLNASSH